MKRKITSILLYFSIIASLLPATVITTQAKTGATIEIGDYVQMGTYYGAPILWRCVDIDENGPLMLSDKILCLKAFDADTSSNPATGSHSRDTERERDGSNYWGDSNIRSWLNSTAAAGEVVWACGNPPSKEYVWGYNAYDSEAGFLTNFNPTELGAIKEVTQKSIVSNVDKDLEGVSGTELYEYNSTNISDILGNYDTAYSEQVTDRMFLLDVKQLNAIYNNKSILGDNYYISEPTAEAVAADETGRAVLGQKLSYWLRTPHVETSNSVWLVLDYRIATAYPDTAIYGVRPAFYLSENAKLLGNGDNKIPYTVSESDTYDISLSADSYDGATVKVDNKSALPNDTITITININKYYELESLSVKGSNTEYMVDSGITKLDDGMYTFEMPSEDVTVTPVFSPVIFTGTRLDYDADKGEMYITSDTTYENARIIIAEYSSDGILIGVNSETVNITGGIPYKKEYMANSNYTTKVMLWNGLGEMIPLADTEQYTEKQISSIGGNSAGAVVLNVQGTGNESEPVIEYTLAESTDEMKTVAAVDASLADGETLDGTAELRIKYDADKGLDATNLLPGYFNPTTNEWETIPYMLDEENHEAIIITDHFSKYGLFEVEGSGTPTAFAKPLEATQIAQMKSDTARRILDVFNTGNTELNEDTIGEVLEALDGSFNGKLTGTGSNINSIISKGGKVDSGFIGKAGTQFTIIGIVGACISVANSAYKKGLTNTETLKAMTKAGISVGVAFASAPIQLAYVGVSMAQMAYDHQQQKEITARHKTIEGIFNMYKNKQGKRTIADWKQEFDKAYKKYYVDELNNTTDNAEERYNKFYTSVHNVISDYAYKFMYDYQSGALYEQYLSVPAYTNETAALAEDLCYNYECEIKSYLSALFLQYSRQAYSDAVKKLEAVCEQEREELNKEITLNFYEYGTDNIAKNYYVKFYDKKSDAWRADFNDEGKAQLKFTYLSYLQMDSPQAITVFDKETNKAVGQIPFPNGSLIPGGERDIPFDTDNVLITVNIHEVRQNSTDPYTYANLKGRLAPITNEQDTDYFSFNLDDKGCAQLQYSLKMYYDDGAPNRVEILDNEGNVIYQTPFNTSMTEIALDGETYSLNISCFDSDSAAYYKYRKAEIVYFESFDAKPSIVQSGIIGSDGKCILTFPKSEYEFHNKDYVLYVYDEDGKEFEHIFDLSQVYEDGNNISEIILRYYNPENPEEFLIEPAELTLGIFDGKKETAKVDVKKGKIAKVKTSNAKVATASITGSISAVGDGTATITFYDHWDQEQTVTVFVTDKTRKYGRYRASKISQIWVRGEPGGPTYNTNEQYWEPGTEDVSYHDVIFNRDESGVISEIMVTYKQDYVLRYMTYQKDAIDTNVFRNNTYGERYITDVSTNSFTEKWIIYSGAGDNAATTTVTYLYELIGNAVDGSWGYSQDEDDE